MTPHTLSEVAVKRILLADDDQYVRSQLKEVFAGLGYQVDTAESCRQLRAKVQEAEYAVVLLDCRLSQEDGLRLLEELTASHGDTSVVMLSADPHLETVIAALRKGAVDFVVKPLDFDELIEIVRKAYDRYELQRMYRVMSQRMRGIDDSPAQRRSVLVESATDVPT